MGETIKVNVVPMTDTRTAVRHRVTDEAVAAGRRAGRYLGVCGAIVVPGSLQEKDARQHCESCRPERKPR